MSVIKTPALPLYGKDAYDDEAFSRLSFGAQGVYWFLAWWQWSEGSIPADLEQILDKVPRKKIAEARRVWAEVLPFFPTIGDGGRRANGTVERHRSKVCGDREKRQKGAAITNAKRWGESLNGSLSESLSDDVSESPRAANESASAVGSLSQHTKTGEGVQGEGRVATPDFEAAARVYEKLRQSALKEIPPEQVAVGLVTEFGEELILETLIDCENEYRGKPWRYFEKILVDRHSNPDKRPGQRRARKAGNGSGERRSDDSGSASATPRDPRPCGKFSEGKETAADVLARLRRAEAERQMPKVPG